MAAKHRLKWMENNTNNPLAVNNALFDAALDEFSSHSFRDASLNDIIKAAGMNKGSFYYRFHDKMDMYLSLLHRKGMDKLDMFKQFYDESKSAGLFDELRQRTVLGLRFAKKEPRYSALWRRVLVEELSVREAIRECFGDITNNMLAQMIQKAKNAGELRSDISTETILTVVSTIMDRVDLFVSPDLNEEGIMKGIDELLSVLKYGIAAK